MTPAIKKELVEISGKSITLRTIKEIHRLCPHNTYVRAEGKWWVYHQVYKRWLIVRRVYTSDQCSVGTQELLSHRKGTVHIARKAYAAYLRHMNMDKVI